MMDPEPAGGPFGVADVETASVAAEPTGRPVGACSCGAGPHVEHAARCAQGHVLAGNGLALVTGSRSAAFWLAHDEARRELRAAIISDAGHTLDDVPRALSIAAESIAQAALIRDSAYLRLAEAGGPLASSGRVRRAFHAWCAAVDRVERHLRLVGLRRVPRLAPSLSEYLAQRYEQSGTGAAEDGDRTPVQGEAAGRADRAPVGRDDAPEDAP